MVATLVATVVTWTLSSHALDRLRAARARNLPAMTFLRDMTAELDRVDSLAKYAGEAEAAEYAAFAAPAREAYAAMTARFRKEGPTILGEADSRALLGQVEKYWADISEDNDVRVKNRARYRKEHAERTAAKLATGATPEELAAGARTAEIDNEFQALHRKLLGEAGKAQQAMDDALARAADEQQRSIAVGVVILFVTALLGALAAWLISGATSRPVRNLRSAALRIAQGDLTHPIQVESADDVGVLARAFQQMVQRLRELVSTLKSASEEMATAAEQLADHTRAQSAMLERQASGVAETSSTTRQLEQSASVAAARAAAVLDVARRAGEMSEAGREAAERSLSELRRIQGSVEGIVTQSTGLLEQARQVGEIVETVRDLATQSHVLSLNASIEAAKAGAAGRSFAEVAQEVRALAEQSGLGATRIGKMVEDILVAVQTTRDMTERGSQGMAGSLDQIRASGDSLRDIGGIVRETSDAALHIASAVQQQSTGITQIAMAMRDLDKGMEETVGRIRALEHSAQLVAETATRISGVAAEFRL